MRCQLEMELSLQIFYSQTIFYSATLSFLLSTLYNLIQSFKFVWINHQFRRSERLEHFISFYFIFSSLVVLSPGFIPKFRVFLIQYCTVDRGGLTITFSLYTNDARASISGQSRRKWANKRNKRKQSNSESWKKKDFVRKKEGSEGKRNESVL